jgi:hypothetical protein
MPHRIWQRWIVPSNSRHTAVLIPCSRSNGSIPIIHKAMRQMAGRTSFRACLPSNPSNSGANWQPGIEPSPQSFTTFLRSRTT